MGDGDVMLIFLNNNPRHPQPPPFFSLLSTLGAFSFPYVIVSEKEGST